MGTAGRQDRGDRIFRGGATFFSLLVLALFLLLLALLVKESLPALRHAGPSFLWSGNWDPVNDEYGALPFLYGTAVSSFLALLIALPLSVGAAVFINEYAPPWLRNPISFLAELLAAVPSVIYGLWGIFVLVPFLREHAMRPLAEAFPFIPLFKGPVYGPSLFASGVLLAIMVSPFILSVSREVIATVPQRQKEAVLSLGGTRWEMIRLVLVQYCLPGIFGAAVLGLGRALGETMAVTMLIGNRPEVAASLFKPGYSMAAVIANEFTEATGKLHPSALVAVGLVLFVLTFAVNVAARMILARMMARTGGEVPR